MARLLLCLRALALRLRATEQARALFHDFNLDACGIKAHLPLCRLTSTKLQRCLAWVARLRHSNSRVNDSCSIAVLQQR